MTIHKFPIRVYYEDTDAGGIVYHANYLNFCERARTEALRDAEISQSGLWKSHGIGFVARSASIDYKRPMHLDDMVVVETSLEKFGKASLTLKQVIMRGEERIATIIIKMAVIDREFKLVTLTGELRELLQKIFD
ncbi:MAG: tol-pal system-associated acyl-CoA thioesterase [Rickettsiales bacterium]